MVKRKRNCGVSKKEKVSFKLTYKPRFNGRDNIFEPWYIMSEAVNIRMYYGGHFVTKKNKTTYERHPSVAPKDFGLDLRLNVEEVCYFEFKYWIMNDLGFNGIGEIWFRKQGCSLFNGRSRIMSYADIPLFLQSPERDGFYHLYLIHPEKEEESVNRLAYGPVVTFYPGSPCETDGSNEMGSMSESINNSLEGGPQDSSTLHSLSDNPRSESTPNTQISLTQPTSATSQPH